MTIPEARAPGGTEGRADTSRALSPAERWYWIIDQLSTLNVCARVRIEGEVPTGALLSGLRELQARQPLLRLAIAREQSASGPRFVPTDNPIPLREVRVAEDEAEQWVREIDEREFAESIDWQSGPLARAIVIRQPDRINDLIMTLPHCISDGTTALAVLRQWVLLAVDPAASGAGAGITDGPVPVPVPVEDLFPARYRAMTGPLPERNAADEDNPDPSAVPTDAVAPAAAGRFQPECFVPFDQRRTRLLHRFIDGDALQDLTLACRREDVTLHGVLAAALACAVARDAGASPPARFAVGSPVSFRDELDRPVPEDEVGCFVSAVHSVVAYQPDDLWGMARFINRDVAERRLRGDQYPVFSLLATQGPMDVADSEPMVRYIEEHGSFNFFISNIGRFNFPEAVGAWRLSGAQFAGGISVVGYLASSVSTSHGRLSWNFTYIDEAVSRERAERIADDTVKTVLMAATA